jgi:hypothetical protein
LKKNVYKNNPHTWEELKQNIELCISNVTAETLHRVASNMRKRVNAWINERGGHFKHTKKHYILFSDFNVIYFLPNITCQKWVAWLFNPL